MDRHLGVDRLQPPAQARHHRLDGVGLDLVAEPVDRVLEQALRHDLAAAAHEQLERGELARRDGDDAAADLQVPHGRIEADIADLDHEPERSAGPAQQRAQPRRELLHGERLEQVVVGAAIEAGDAVVDAVARRQDHDRYVARGVAQVRNDVEAVAVGKAEVEDDRVVGDALRRREPVLAGCERVDSESEARETVNDRLRQALVILDQKNAHRVTPPDSGGRCPAAAEAKPGRGRQMTAATRQVEPLVARFGRGYAPRARVP